MPKSSWQKAARRAEERMGSGADDYNLNGDWVSGLTELANQLHNTDCPNDSESTTATGRMGNTLYLARQGGKNISYNESKIKDDFKVTSVIDCTFKEKIEDRAPSGLHAEMMIVRYILKNAIIAKDQLTRSESGNVGNNQLQIGTTKGCCLDCAGWLNERGVPHTVTTGKPSLMWRHPVTLSLYRHENTKANNVFLNLKFYKAVGMAELK